jgi:predicted restriction endonuclease
VATNEHASPRTNWDDLIDGMQRGRGNNRDVVHRPLFVLFLLARAQRGNDNGLRFNDIDGPFESAIRRFGRSRKPSGCHYPFWYLQRDGFWKVEDGDSLPKVKNKDLPLKKSLIARNARGYVPAELWDQLTADPELIRRLARKILNEYWNLGLREEIPAVVGLNLPG